MFQKSYSFAATLLLAGAAVLMMPGLSQAQRGGGHHGGGHGGGFHSGGFHSGGFHSGGFHSGGCFHSGGFHSGGFHSGNRWWYPRYGGYYGAWPSYYSSYPYSSYSDYYPDAYSSDWSSPAYDSGYYGYYGDVTSSDARALINLSVPADAEIWFEGSKMTSTGSVREYQSPPLEPGGRYTYDIRARWEENGHEVTQTQQIEVTAGTRVDVHFPVQPTKAPTGSSH
jgi:uncharacterized protein (TIGR03000 family)